MRPDARTQDVGVGVGYGVAGDRTTRRKPDPAWFWLNPQVGGQRRPTRTAAMSSLRCVPTVTAFTMCSSIAVVTDAERDNDD